MQKKIHILFDADPLVGKKTGVGFYTYGLLQSLSEQPNIRLTCHYFNFLGKERVTLPQSDNITYRPTFFIPRKLINMLRRLGINIFFELLIKTKGDFILFPNFLSRPSLYKTPYSPVIHDMTFKEYPQYVEQTNLSDLNKFMQHTVEYAAFITTISSTSEKLIKKHYNLKKKFFVQHIPPNQIIYRENKSILKKYNIKKPFIFFIGTLEPRKNVEKLIEGYLSSSWLIKNYSLVISGGWGWKFSNLENMLNQKKTNGGDIILTGYVSDDDKWSLYKFSSIIVIPSLYEGYGIQISEAYSMRKLLAVSDIPVFREVAGNGASFFNPLDKRSISNTISQTLQDKKLQKKLSGEQINIIRRLQWDDVARSMVEMIYKSLHNIDS